MANQERVGTKRLVVGAHYGTIDFIVQRVTAVFMAAYTVYLFLAYLFISEMNFEAWRRLFTFSVGAVPVGHMLTTVMFISVCWHAWVGVRDIWMDYARIAGLRLFLHAFTVLWLVASIIYFVKILWSV